jgi:hypothetical protein
MRSYNITIVPGNPVLVKQTLAQLRRANIPVSFQNHDTLVVQGRGNDQLDASARMVRLLNSK